nr:hypothetical protein [Tanacetum cinerariifolium]
MEEGVLEQWVLLFVLHAKRGKSVSVRMVESEYQSPPQPPQAHPGNYPRYFAKIGGILARFSSLPLHILFAWNFMSQDVKRCHVPNEYVYLGKYACVCRHCGTMFWKLKRNAKLSCVQEPQYTRRRGGPNGFYYGGNVDAEVVSRNFSFGNGTRARTQTQTGNTNNGGDDGFNMRRYFRCTGAFDSVFEFLGLIFMSIEIVPEMDSLINRASM